MKRFKRIVALLFAGFLAFAPPGTLIFGALLIFSLIRNTGVIAICAVGFAVLVVIWLLLRRRASRTSKTPDRV